MPPPSDSRTMDAREAARVTDQYFHASQARAFASLSPASLSLAWLDWAMHLAASPGKQTELLRLLPKRRLVVRAEVNEAYVAALKTGMQAEIVEESASGGPPIPARLERIGSVFQVMTPGDDPQERISRRGVECLLSIETPEKLRVGQRVLVRFLP